MSKSSLVFLPFAVGDNVSGCSVPSDSGSVPNSLVVPTWSTAQSSRFRGMAAVDSHSWSNDHHHGCSTGFRSLTSHQSFKSTSSNRSEDCVQSSNLSGRSKVRGHRELRSSRLGGFSLSSSSVAGDICGSLVVLFRRTGLPRRVLQEVVDLDCCACLPFGLHHWVGRPSRCNVSGPDAACLHVSQSADVWFWLQVPELLLGLGRAERDQSRDGADLQSSD